MKVKLITVSKEDDGPVNAIFSDYAKRLIHYCNFEYINIRPTKSLLAEEQRSSDASKLSKKISAREEMVLLDEQGIELTSFDFAELLMKKMNSGTKGLCFVVGGAYGFHKSIYDKSSLMISLSKMTLPHQLAKIIFIEQLYRGFTIIKNEKYHH